MIDQRNSRCDCGCGCNNAFSGGLFEDNSLLFFIIIFLLLFTDFNFRR